MKANKTLQHSKSVMKPTNPLACVNTDGHVRKKSFVAFSSPTRRCPFVAFGVFNSVCSFGRSPWRPPPPSSGVGVAQVRGGQAEGLFWQTEHASLGLLVRGSLKLQERTFQKTPLTGGLVTHCQANRFSTS